MTEDTRPPAKPDRDHDGFGGKEILLQTINEFALNLFAIRTRDDLFWYVAREVVGRMGFDDCVIYQIDQDRNVLCQVAAIGSKNPKGREIANALEIPVGQGITGHVAQSRRPEVVADLTKDDRYIADLEPALSEICVPLFIDDQVVGLIDCEDTRPDHFGDEHLETLTTIAALTGAKMKLIGETARVEEQSAALSRLNEQLRTEAEERKKSLEALRRSEERLQQAAELAGLGHWVWDSITDRCLFCSERYARLHGVTPEQYIARAAGLDGSFGLTHPEDRAALRENLRALRGGAAIAMEYRTLGPDGKIRHVREVARPIFDDEGRVVQEIGTCLDVTQHKQIEKDIRTREVWLRAILENSPLQIVLKDTERRIMAISKNVGATLELTPSEFIGFRTSDFLPPELAEIYDKADRHVLATGEALQQETVEELDGKTQHYLNAKFPLRDDAGVIIGVCSLTSEISDLKTAETHLLRAQKMEAIGQLTGGLAHDLNNLLAVIQGNAEFLASKTPEHGSLTDPILRASARGAELTQRLLAFARQQPLAPKSVDLKALVASMSDLLSGTLGATIEIETKSDSDLWQARADPGQVENALLNLALNARDAMSKGGKLTIETSNAPLDDRYVVEHADAMSGDYIVLAVSDSGTGMTPEVQARAFEPFFTTKGVGQGSGLGLSVVYGFAKQSGGHVNIYSEPGRGTTVKLYLPRAAAPAAAQAARPRDALPPGQNERILVIEDDPDVRSLADRMLVSLGYRVTATADAAGARMLLASGEAFDLVLSDVILPGGTSGPEFADEAKASHPALGFIFMSGYPADAAKRNGFVGSDKVLLNKPFQLAQLAKVLREALD